MLLDFLASNNWKRPVYFTSPSAIEKVLDVDKYCHLEGIVYRFLPVVAENYIQGLGGINIDETYDLLVNKAKWGNLNDPDVYLDPESRRNSIMPKQNYMRLAQALIENNKKDSAIVVLDRCQYFFPNEKIPYDIYTLPFVDAYYEAGAFEKGNEVSEIILNNFEQNLEYYSSLNAHFSKNYDQEKQRAFAVLQQLSKLAKQNKQDELASRIDSVFSIQLENY